MEYNEIILNNHKLINLMPLQIISNTNYDLLINTINDVSYISPYIYQLINKDSDLLTNLVLSGDLFRIKSIDTYEKNINELLVHSNSQLSLNKLLRNYRNQEMVRIAWRDIAGWATIEETLCELTLLAEAFIKTIFEHIFTNVGHSIGYPLNQSGDVQRVCILGMGKLGAWELNFSSDIDLIFFYEQDGVINNKKETSFQQFYTKVVQYFIKTLDDITEDGFVYRVDTRLRPFGESGPLIMNFDGMENYYQSQAREWERYAMVKARVIYGDIDSGNRLQCFISAFVYRRYLDYRALGELRQLKLKITQELQRKDRLDNIKLGPGGIREIEFIGQVFQLIRGGHEKELRDRRIIKILKIIGKNGYFPIDLVNKLISSYFFLRKVENRIQQYADKQTHDLPIGECQQRSLAFSFGYSEWSLFKKYLDGIRSEVHQIFSQVIESPQIDDDTLSAYWLDMNINNLSSSFEDIGFHDSNEIVPLFIQFRDSYSVRHISGRGASELNKLLPSIMRASLQCANPNETFSRILKLLESVAGRNVYYTLLNENPIALSQLVKLSSASSWIVNFIAQHPLLLDELLDPRTLYEPLSLRALKENLQRQLNNIDIDDFEQLLTCFRQFKQTQLLRIATADIFGFIRVMIVSDYLTWLAETLVDCALTHAWRLTVEKFGLPPNAQIDQLCGIGVVAYGKMGGIELGYASDLDLVFLYNGQYDNVQTNGANQIPLPQFYARVVKRIISIFTTQVFSGTLYEIDLRLRPSGNSGLLVCSLEAFDRYQMEQAWIWEQQALVRARFVAGDSSIAFQFEKLRKKSLCRERNEDLLRNEVKQMRLKMRDNLEIKSKNCFDIKQASGGIADIEFIVQFGVLLNAHRYPSLTQFTDVVRLLDCLHETEFLTVDECQILREAYCLYREQTHRSSLLEQSAVAPVNDFLIIRNKVQDIWRTKFEINKHLRN